MKLNLERENSSWVDANLYLIESENPINVLPDPGDVFGSQRDPSHPTSFDFRFSPGEFEDESIIYKIVYLKKKPNKIDPNLLSYEVKEYTM